MITRRTFLRQIGRLGAAGLCLGGYAVAGEPMRLRVQRYRPQPPGWPKGLKLRIAALADIHACRPWMGPGRIAHIVARTHDLRPDLIVLLGDYVAGHRYRTGGIDSTEWAPVLGRLRAPLGVHAVMGNHDWWEDRAAQRRGAGPTLFHRRLVDQGIRVLENDAIRLDTGDGHFWLAGLGDQLAFPPYRGHGRSRWQGVDDLPGTLAQLSDDAPAILLAHEPDIFPRVPARFAMTLAGHTHGGQVRLFGHSPLVPSRFGNRFAYGHVREDRAGRPARPRRLRWARLFDHAGSPRRAARDRGDRPRLTLAPAPARGVPSPCGVKRSPAVRQSAAQASRRPHLRERSHMPGTPSLLDALPVWVKIGLLSFGGPAGQIALMQDEVVTRRRWVPGESFDRGLAFSMLLPGPEAQQLATWLGWRLHGLAGGLIAGGAFILPGAALMILLAWVAAAHGDVPWVAAIFAGVQPVVIALVLAALWRIASRALAHPAHWALAVLAFVALFWAGIPFPLVIAAAALAGLFVPGAPPAAHGSAPGPASPARQGRQASTGHLWRHAAATLALTAALVAAAFLLVRMTAGAAPFDDVAQLFTTAALVTFGGAYAVLPFVAGEAVGTYGWLDPAQMLNGLAIAEATPGPLILVNTYAGFFAGWGTGTGTAVATATLATFYTFAPSFALILAFAPAVERVSEIPWARKALAGVSAAIVGVILEPGVFPGRCRVPAARLVRRRMGQAGAFRRGLAGGLPFARRHGPADRRRHRGWIGALVAGCDVGLIPAGRPR